MRDPLAKDFNLSEEQVFAGHANSIFRALFSPDGSQVVTVSTDNTARWWDVNANAELFTIRLPAYREDNQPTLWDFDFRCLSNGECWLGIPLTQGKLLLYHFEHVYD